MKLNPGILIFILLFSANLFLNSCKTVKPIAEKKPKSSLDNIYDSIKLAEYEYESLNIKFNVKYEKKSQSMNLKGNLKILKDSIIWVSLSPGLGIEAARLMCTKDSIFFLDKINGSLTKGKYEYIKNLYKIDVDYYSLQAILTNNFFIYPTIKNEKAEFTKNFSLTKDSTELAVYRKNELLVENLVNINRAVYRISSYFINDVPNKRSLSVKYSADVNQKQKSFPGSISIKSFNADKFLLLDLDYTKVTVNEALTFSFKVPQDYRLIVH